MLFIRPCSPILAQIGTDHTYEQNTPISIQLLTLGGGGHAVA
jgi:hypothetical protein